MKFAQKFAHKIAHLLFPRESNNQKAKLLHPSSLTILTFLLIGFQLVLNFFPKLYPRILGYAANIPPSEIIRLTNEKRAQNGLPALTENGTLSRAAQAKGADMLNKGYWAHVAPDGTQPWSFFTSFGYLYRYAGENLARDFSNPSSTVDAWMASPSHRDNLLNSKYKEIGVAVVEGSLAGVDTTIVVQFFGTKYADSVPAVPVAKAQTTSTSSSKPAPTVIAVSTPGPSMPSSPMPEANLATSPKEAGVSGKPLLNLISPFVTTRNISLLIIIGLLIVLAVDAFVVQKRKIARIGGRSFAHFAFLGMILIIVLILKAGQII